MTDTLLLAPLILGIAVVFAFLYFVAFIFMNKYDSGTPLITLVVVITAVVGLLAFVFSTSSVILSYGIIVAFVFFSVLYARNRL